MQFLLAATKSLPGALVGACAAILLASAFMRRKPSWHIAFAIAFGIASAQGVQAQWPLASSVYPLLLAAIVGLSVGAAMYFHRNEA